MKAYVVSLGCPKNQVDTEQFIGYLLKNNFELVKDYEKADLYIINTCSFIYPAKKEAIEEILKAIELKKKYKFFLGVLGCFYRRYKKNLISNFPEVDFFIDTANPSLDKTDIYYRFGKYSENISKFLKILWILKNFTKRKAVKYQIFLNYPVGYLKISDGCSNRCSYCSIPLIKGNFVFYDLSYIKNSLKKMKESNIKEVYICAQDTTAHPNLFKILELVAEFNFLRKKVLYLYPNKIKAELLKLLKELNFDPYLEIPLQHVNFRILKLMGRFYTKKDIYKLFDKIEKYFPESHIRSTFILGHFGETKKSLEELKNFLSTYKLTWVGFFPYYKEEGTKSFLYPDLLSPKIKHKIVEEFYEFQSYITQNILEKYINKREEVIIDFEIKDNYIKSDLASYFKDFNFKEFYLYQGRLPFEAFSLDGVVYVFSKVKLQVGSLIKVNLEKFLPPYDFVCIV